MISLLFLFLAVPAVFSAEPKCPDGFTHFKRTPTSRNNYTSDWCLKFVVYEGSGNRDHARHICILNNATISIPENPEEVYVMSDVAKKLNISNLHAIDGQVSPKCLNMYTRQKFYFDKVQGECNQMNDLLLFEDSNTDPTLVKILSPNHLISSWTRDFYGNTMVTIFGTCLTMGHAYEDKGKQYDVEFGNDYCIGRQGAPHGPSTYDSISSVLCGRHPL